MLKRGIGYISQSLAVEKLDAFLKRGKQNAGVSVFLKIWRKGTVDIGY
jgi:hypothetical protein